MESGSCRCTSLVGSQCASNRPYITSHMGPRSYWDEGATFIKLYLTVVGLLVQLHQTITLHAFVSILCIFKYGCHSSSSHHWCGDIYISAGEKEYCAVQITPDGRNWTSYEMKDTGDFDQPSVVRPVPGNATLLSYYRDRRRRHIYVAHSTDDGESWSTPEKTQFPNNNAGIQAYTLANQHIVLVYNPTTHGRHPLRISLSEDGGKTWPYYRDLESGKGPEYSYPCILQTSDEYIHVSYTFNRATIKYVKFKEDWIKTKFSDYN